MQLVSQETSGGEKYCSVCTDHQIAFKTGQNIPIFWKHVSLLGQQLLLGTAQQHRRWFVLSSPFLLPKMKRSPPSDLTDTPRLRSLCPAWSWPDTVTAVSSFHTLPPPEGITQQPENRYQPYSLGSFFISAANISSSTALRSICSHLNGLFYTAKWRNGDFMSTSGASSALKTV